MGVIQCLDEILERLQIVVGFRYKPLERLKLCVGVFQLLLDHVRTGKQHSHEERQGEQCPDS